MLLVGVGWLVHESEMHAHIYTHALWRQATEGKGKVGGAFARPYPYHLATRTHVLHRDTIT